MLCCLFALWQCFFDIHECVCLLPMQICVIFLSFWSKNAHFHVFVVTMATKQNFYFLLLFSLFT